MTATHKASAASAGHLVKVPAWRMLKLLAGGPMAGVEAIGRHCDGALARLSLGPMRVHLITHPDQVTHVLANRGDVYRREGMLWEPIQQLEGYGIAGEGPQWATSRRILQPLLTMHHTRTLLPAIAHGVNEALDELAERTRDRQPVDVLAEMMRITHRVMLRVFFANRISNRDAERLGRAVNAAFEALTWRMAAPFVPRWVAMPGDQRFRRATRLANAIIYPLIRASDGDDDLVAHFVNATNDNGRPLSERQVRDDLVGMFVAGTETTALMLTWLWVLLDAHPEVATQLTNEAVTVVGDSAPSEDHLPRLVHTRMALQEALRLFPIGWMLPRRLADDDTLAGVTLRAGSTVVLSPYLTHRLPQFWPHPQMFNPQRFAPGNTIAKGAYIPFGLGGHNCLGQHFSLGEAQLAVAGLLARWRPQIVHPQSLTPRPTASLRPTGRPRMLLSPRR